jgi:hypothetical protein
MASAVGHAFGGDSSDFIEIQKDTSKNYKFDIATYEKH